MKKYFGCIAVLVGIAVLATSCKKDDNKTSTTTTAPPASTAGPHHITVTFDGTARNWPEIVIGSGLNECGPFFTSDGTNFNVSPCGGMGSLTSTFNVTFANNLYTNNYYLNTNNDSLFHAVMKVGNHAFTNGTTKGVRLTFTDATGNWESDTGPQTGSLFTVTESISLPDYMGDLFHDTRFTFNCKLYNDDGSGNFILATSGSGFLRYVTAK
ncbi:MAG: hypothetical protein ABI772_13770 [Bacteroidota bacterium]